jgi:Fic family protein
MYMKPAKKAPMPTPSWMEPMLPSDGGRALEDIAFDLISSSNALAGQIHPIVTESVGNLVRSMNCYYSNLIEGHDTHPRDIDRALHKDYSTEPRKRALQLEAVAHIEVQKAIDEGDDPKDFPASSAYAIWLHSEFCRRLPDELLWVEDPETKRRIRLTPGALRDGEVVVGLHLPPPAAALSGFLRRFEQVYSPQSLSKVRQVTAVAAAHHRFLWIHPFYDGNGRVARLMSHALLRRLGVGNSLWSVARGLARNVGDYKSLLMAADASRRGDLDGRGNLSQAALDSFCEFFLRVSNDQVLYMSSILQPSELLRRMEIYVEDETRAGRLPKGSFPLLREALIAGEFDRGLAPSLTGYKERMARTVVSKLLDAGLLVSPSHVARLRLGFPLAVVERWFPALYPATSYTTS